jgi:hypothetical protein
LVLLLERALAARRAQRKVKRRDYGKVGVRLEKNSVRCIVISDVNRKLQSAQREHR